jgi:cob(I)alamin adenosyltransferase
MALKIYTKTGDKGTTSLIGGTKVPKNNIRIEAYGTVDELNSYIGFVSDLFNQPNTISILREVQDRLFTIGSSLACDPTREPLMKMPDLTELDVLFLEKQIDEMNVVLEPMKFFVLPGGHQAVSVAHIARCVCRRAERLCVDLEQKGQFVDVLVIKYLNRLSDFLFVLSRFIAKQMAVDEIPWRPRVK